MTDADQGVFQILHTLNPLAFSKTELTKIYKDLLNELHQQQQLSFSDCIRHSDIDPEQSIESTHKPPNYLTIVATLIKQRSNFIDLILQQLWSYHQLDQIDGLTLVAVGGYGREELHPLSDIDLLIISKEILSTETDLKISALIAQLWDFNLTIGHSVRTFTQCLTLAKEEITVITNLQESRFLLGDSALFALLYQKIMAHDLWSASDFYNSKCAEQQQRYLQYHNTTYNLEPDIKLNPGGLRDIHTLIWIAHHLFHTRTLEEMRATAILTPAEHKELTYCLHFLWTIRFALHLIIKRYDNRLLFVHQQAVAELLGYGSQTKEPDSAPNHKQPHEKMMRDFYRVLARVNELNQMLLQLIGTDLQSINPDEQMANKRLPLNNHFYAQGHLICTNKASLFQSTPESIIELFYLIAATPNISDIAVRTLRQLHNVRHKITRPLVELKSARLFFSQLLALPEAIEYALPLMHQHNILSLYLPQWQRISGQMQFDLFHAYTVDEHTIRLLKHIHYFTLIDSTDSHPICHQVYPQLSKKYCLIIAALFHDIGKGSGVDHATFGADIVAQFCQQHDYAHHDRQLMVWLVKNHLLLSLTAQKQDIYDEAVIHHFADQVQSIERLNFLLCLTVADICATNQTIWNQWKRTLIGDLYQQTLAVLKDRFIITDRQLSVKEQVRYKRNQAQGLLQQQGFNIEKVQQLWSSFKLDYFMRYSIGQITWHSQSLLEQIDTTSNPETEPNQNTPVILMRNEINQGTTELFIYAPDRPNLFAHIVTYLSLKRLNIHAAQIMTTIDNHAMDTFLIVDQKGAMINPVYHQEIIDTLAKTLQTQTITSILPKIAHHLLPFKVKPMVIFNKLKGRNRKNKTSIEVIALDMQGLLTKIANVFVAQGLTLHSAKITTIGEKAEDTFVLSKIDHTIIDKTKSERALTEDEQNLLRIALLEQLSQ